MAGINRLGKAAPRPGSLRPPDPTRNRITDHFSENIEGLESDRDYQRAVQDIEDAQQTQGWLFGRGAFDKTDLLYLRDQEEKSRHTEIELHDREIQQYAKLRTQTERQRPGGGLAAGSLGVTKKIGKDKPRPPPKVLQRIVKVSRTAGGAAVPGASTQPAAAPAAPPVAVVAQDANADSSAGLGGLLGAYGSASDSDDERDGGAQATGRPAAGGPAAAGGVSVPTPAAAAATGPQLHAAGATAGLARHRGRSRSPADEPRDAEEELDYGT